MRVLSIFIPSASCFELIFVLVLRLVLWSVIIIIPLVLWWQNKAIRMKGGRVMRMYFFFSFLRRRESFLYKLRWPSLQIRASARHSLWLMGFRLNCSASSKRNGEQHEPQRTEEMSSLLALQMESIMRRLKILLLVFAVCFFSSCEDYCRTATCWQHPAVMDIKTVGFLFGVVLVNKTTKEWLSKDLLNGSSGQSSSFLEVT